MYEPGKRGYPSDTGTTSRIVHRGRCNIWAAYVNQPTAVGNVQLYDGIDASGRLKWAAGNANGNEEWIEPSRPIYCDQGIYFNLSAGAAYMMVIFEPLGDVDEIDQLVG